MRAYALVLVLIAACSKSNPEKAESLDAAGSARAAGSASVPAAGPPVSASFVELSPGASARSQFIPRCSELIVASVRGNVSADGAPLAPGDVLAIRGETRATLRGEGLLLVATARLDQCESPSTHAIVKGDAARDLSFMHGAMHARLDLDDRNVAPSFYFGRLSGTAAVPEHAHAGTWELLCAIDAAGTFTLAGAPSHLGGRQCVTVPPDTKHSWQPDPGSTLTALQMYWPPGPEQRFKKLAAEELAGGPPDRDH